MANIEDYLKWRGDITLKQSPFNEVDNLILSELSYIEISKKNTLKKLTVRDAVALYLEKYDERELSKKFFLSMNPYSFFKRLGESKRFGPLKISHYVNRISKKEEKQFSAMQIELNYNTIYVAFKGTDETLIGWKEDLNMSYIDEIPSQKEAVVYVNKISFRYRHIYLGGHSKGGNLAVYAGVKSKKGIQKRIESIFNNDGPGFMENFLLSPTYTLLLPKIVTLQPETSIIGMLLMQKNDYKVIKSNSTGLWQHDPLTWQVEGTSFIILKEVDETSNNIKKTITDWLEHVDKKRREVFINTLYQVLEKNDIKTVEELTKLKIRSLPGILKTYTKLDEETRKIIVNTIKELMKEASKHFNRKTIFHGLKSITKKRS